MRLLCAFLASGLLLLSGVAVQGEDSPASIVETRLIWSGAPHNAFTDLVYHNNMWYCVFREGTKHVSPDGGLRVLSSPDGKEWKSLAKITAPDADLRDAKISVAPDGRLCLTGAGAWNDPAKGNHQSYLWYSQDGTDWGEAIPVGDPNFWLWRITWHDGKAYGIGYKSGKSIDRSVRLYVSEDGRHFRSLVSDLSHDGFVNESSLLFLPDNTLLAIVRRDGKPADALLGTAQPPYTDWNFRSLNVQIGGPQLLQLPDGRIVVGGRRYPGGAKMQLWWLDPATAQLKEIITLPSGGDTSYPGLVYHDGLLWVSYYSSHEGKTQIYLSKVKLD
jgi:hypothetical protein